jgi:ABC-type multidrug transport system fused ATPase/permease subunit
MQGEKQKFKFSKDSLRDLKKLYRFIKPHQTTFIVGFLFLIISSLSSLAMFNSMGKLIDIQAENFAENIRSIVIFLVIILVIQAIASYFRIYTFAIVTENAIAQLRKETYSRLIFLPMVYFSDKRVGELNSRISADISSIKDTLTSVFAEFVRQIIIIIGSIVLLGYTSWQLVVFILAVIPVLVVFAVIFGRYIRKLSKKAQELVAESNTIVEETLQAILTVKAFTGELFEINRYNKKNDEIIKLGINNSKYRGIFAAFIIVFLFGAIVGVIWFGASLVNKGVITNGELFSFFLLSVFMAASIAGLAETWAALQRALGSVEQVMKILEEQPEDASGDASKKRFSGQIEFNNVVFSYPGNKDILTLNGISFRANSGEQIAIVGPSGAGKSTITSLLMRFYSINSGSIKLDGIEIEKYALHQYRQNFAVVPQDVILFGGTIRENIAYGNLNATDDEIIQAAKQANALDFIKELPYGFDTIVGERGTKLSGGQRQRVAIARAILRNPAVLILDEATSSLDSESERLVQSALDKLMQGRTSIVIAHRLSTIRNADKIIVLEKGVVKESGTHAELINLDHGLYKHLNSLQSEFNEIVLNP